MKLPTPPPTRPDEGGAAARFLAQNPAYVREASERYWSWDQLRRHPIPDRTAPETAWAAVELVRSSNRREIPFLRGRDGATFGLWLTERAWMTMLRVQGAIADPLALAEAAFGHAGPARFLADALIEEAVESSLLEGAISTRREGRKLLREGRRPRDRSERMMVNYLATVKMLARVAHEPLSGDLVREIHRSVTDGTLDERRHEGRLQQPGEARVRVVDGEGNTVHSPPPADELPARLDALCRFANEETSLPAAVRAILLHHQLAFDHPFVDGTGRTARALFYWSMLRDGHPLVQYPSLSAVLRKAPVQYSRSYVHSEQTGDLTYFVLHQLDVFARAVTGFADHVKARVRARHEADQALHRWPMLNVRQRMAISAALWEPTAPLRGPSFAAAHGVSRVTAMKDLRGLAEVGLLTEIRRGRELEYRPAPDLASTIETGPKA